jgi:hypothetical protein
MRFSRYLWFCLVALISAQSMASQPIPPTQAQSPAIAVGPYHSNVFAGSWQTPDDLCNNNTPRYYGEGQAIFESVTPDGAFGFRCNVRRYNGSISSVLRASGRAGCAPGSTFEPTINACLTPTCPSGYELSADKTLCIPQVCPSDMRNWNGECKPLCLFLQSVNQTTGDCECSRNNPSLTNNENKDTGGDGPIPDSVCLGGCKFVVGDGLGLGGKYWFAKREQATGEMCGADDGADEPPPPKKEPPCQPGEGVMTSSSGTVACVPEGTKGAADPVQEEKVKSEQFPDGSRRDTVENTTSDPRTGATTTTTTSTSTGGMAGPQGETKTASQTKGTGTGISQGDGDGCEGDDCGDGDNDGFNPVDGYGLYEPSERTFQQVWNEFVARVNAAPLPAATSTFFAVSSIPASCGGLTASVPFLDVTVSADEYFCGESGQTLMTIARVVIASLAAWLAFRIVWR